MIDAAAEFEADRFLHVVHLHGDILKKEHGFIFTEEEYSRASISGRHHWYQRAGSDYIASCPIFIGTSLAEPIFKNEIERAKRNGALVSGRGYVVTPDELSEIQIKSLKGKGLVHIRAKLSDFVAWLKATFPAGISPADVLEKKSDFSDTVISSLTAADIEAAHYVKPIKSTDLVRRASAWNEEEKSTRARRFLQGFAPDWLLAGSDIPVKLDGFAQVSENLNGAFENSQRMFVVLGPAGSGKTTATMSALVEYGARNPTVPIYEMSRDTHSPAQVFKLLIRLHKERFILYISDLFLFGDAFREVITSVDSGSMLVVASARQSEWSDHLSRYYGDISNISIFQKFSQADFDPLIDKILGYVPAPRFRKLSRVEQYKELTRSKSQLLIALREATDSKNFNEIIADEYKSIQDKDTRSLLLIVGVATMARVGISLELAVEAYGYLSPRREFWRALEGLEGIVSVSDGGRYFARHDIYVRYIIENLASSFEMSEVLKSILKSYVKYKMPIIKSVNRQDSHLFKFVLNKDFMKDISDGNIDIGVNVYSSFDVDFQLDGHFWLQYGLYMASFNKLGDAIQMLENSIRAFSGNPYATHALAGIQLRLAEQRKEYDSVTKDLIRTAVRTLNLMDSQPTLSIDEYPIVTLSNGHVSALIRHGRIDEATSVAKEYFEKLKAKTRTSSSPAMDSMQGKLVKFVTLGEWGSSSASNRKGRTQKKAGK